MGLIDQELAKQAEEEAKYWHEVLRRVISVIIFISERGLAFRSDNENFGSEQNGNYLGILELLAEYDTFKNTQNLNTQNTIISKIMENAGAGIQISYHRRYAKNFWKSLAKKFSMKSFLE